jgi:hypothetical protein
MAQGPALRCTGPWRHSLCPVPRQASVPSRGTTAERHSLGCGSDTGGILRRH